MYFIFEDLDDDQKTTTCRPTVKHNEQLFYDCDPLVGPLADFNPLSIVYFQYSESYGEWQIKKNLDAQGFIDEGAVNINYVDYQAVDLSSGSVCIDHNANALDYDGAYNYRPHRHSAKNHSAKKTFG